MGQVYLGDQKNSCQTQQCPTTNEKITCAHSNLLLVLIVKRKPLCLALLEAPMGKTESGKGFQTPVSNTGVKQTESCFEVGIDWIAGTCLQSQASELMKFLAQFFRDEFTLGRGGIGFYQQSYRSVLGMVVGMYPYESPQNRQDCYFSIPSSVLSTIHQSRVQVLMRALTKKFSFHYSRLDLKADDYTKTITPELAYNAYERGCVAGFRSYRWISSGSLKTGVGCTLELGRRGKSGAGKFVRIYNKTVESKGAIDATRLELELSGERCRQAAGVLVECPPELFAQCILCCISASLDFIERDSSGRRDRATRLPWWSALVDAVEKISLSVSRSPQTIEKMKSWINKQVSPVLATLLSSFPTTDDWWEFFWGAVLDGEARMKDRHHAIVKVARMQRDILEYT